MGTIELITIDNILNYYENPRHETGKNEKDTLIKLFNSVGSQYMLNLAEDIQAHGLLGNTHLVVVYSAEIKKYIVYEGNRRLAAIKLLLDPDSFAFLGESVINRAKAIAKKGFELDKVLCYVTNEEEAFFIMERMHGGEDKGRGIKAWSSKEKEKFNARQNHKITISYLIYENIKRYCENFEITTILPFTTLERIFGNSKIKQMLNLNIKDERSFTPLKMKLIKELCDYVRNKSSSTGIAVTRLFNKSESIENELLPWIKQHLEEDMEEKATAEDNNNRLTDQFDSKADKIQSREHGSENELTDENKQSPSASGNEAIAHDDGYAMIEPTGNIIKRSRHDWRFTKSEINKLKNIREKNLLGRKIYQLSYEITTLDIQKYPCAICGVYRALLECATRYYFTENNHSYSEQSLQENVLLALNIMSSPGNPGLQKHIKLWRETIKKRALIDTLNLYMHRENEIDLDYLEQTWKTIKPYIIECIQ